MCSLFHRTLIDLVQGQVSALRVHTSARISPRCKYTTSLSVSIDDILAFYLDSSSVYYNIKQFYFQPDCCSEHLIGCATLAPPIASKMHGMICGTVKPMVWLQWQTQKLKYYIQLTWAILRLGKIPSQGYRLYLGLEVSSWKYGDWWFWTACGLQALHLKDPSCSIWRLSAGVSLSLCGSFCCFYALIPPRTPSRCPRVSPLCVLIVFHIAQVPIAKLPLQWPAHLSRKVPKLASLSSAGPELWCFGPY